MNNKNEEQKNDWIEVLDNDLEYLDFVQERKDEYLESMIAFFEDNGEEDVSLFKLTHQQLHSVWESDD